MPSFSSPSAAMDVLLTRIGLLLQTTQEKLSLMLEVAQEELSSMQDAT